MLLNDDMLCGSHRLGPPAFAVSRITAKIKVEERMLGLFALLPDQCGFSNFQSNIFLFDTEIIVAMLYLKSPTAIIKNREKHPKWLSVNVY